MDKLQHWCGSQAENAPKGAPVLEFDVLVYAARVHQIAVANGCQDLPIGTTHVERINICREELA